MELSDLTHPDLVRLDLESTAKDDVLGELGALLATREPALSVEQVKKLLVMRERLASTGVGEGVAIPHGKAQEVGSIALAVGISRAGVPFDAVDGKPVHILFALLAPENAGSDNLKALARISRLLKDPVIRAGILAAGSPEEIIAILKEEGGKH